MPKYMDYYSWVLSVFPYTYNSETSIESFHPEMPWGYRCHLEGHNVYERDGRLTFYFAGRFVFLRLPQTADSHLLTRDDSEAAKLVNQAVYSAK